MKKYLNPEIDIKKFATEEIITSSGAQKVTEQGRTSINGDGTVFDN